MRFGGEIGIKGEWTKRTYEKLLLRNIKRALAYCDLVPDEIARRRCRIYVRTPNAQETASALTRVFGISSVSPAIETSSNAEEIVERALKSATEAIRKRSSFAVRCHRVGTHEYSSMDICKEAGKQILENLKDRDIRVNLTNPQHTISVEVRDDEAYIFTETLQGPGGFPVGSQAKAVCLISGGIDSPVACWLTMKRGCPIVPVYLDNSPLTDETTTSKAVDTAKKLLEWAIGFPKKMYIVPHGKNLETFMEKAPRKLTCLLCKRMMYRIAERIAKIENAEGVVTGEAIGEQASQTMHNLRVLNEAATSYPIHRPLLGFDKTETEKLAKKIGTFEISIQRAKGCTAAPNQPATRAKLEMVEEAEKGLDMKRMVEESLSAARTLIL